MTRTRLLRELSALALPSAGRAWTLTSRRARLNGFPFRLDVELDDARLAEPSGWVVSTPRLMAEAQLYDPTRWVGFAPEPVTVTRRAAGPLVIRAKVLRASLGEAAARPPRLSIEALDMTFATPQGARPFALTRAGEFDFHSRPGPDDEGAVYIGVVDATANPASWLNRIGGPGPITLTLDGLFSHADAGRGATWPEALANWARAGGSLQLRQGLARVGRRSLRVNGLLRFGSDGRPVGDLAAETQGLAVPARTVLHLSAGGAILAGRPFGATPSLF